MPLSDRPNTQIMMLSRNQSIVQIRDAIAEAERNAEAKYDLHFVHVGKPLGHICILLQEYLTAGWLQSFSVINHTEFPGPAETLAWTVFWQRVSVLDAERREFVGLIRTDATYGFGWLLEAQRALQDDQNAIDGKTVVALAGGKMIDEYCWLVPGDFPIRHEGPLLHEALPRVFYQSMRSVGETAIVLPEPLVAIEE